MEAKNKREDSLRTFDQQAAHYDQDSCGSHARSLYPHVVREVIGSNPQRVLDLGCGTGGLASLVLEALPGCKLGG